jgi:hypothetical protein
MNKQIVLDIIAMILGFFLIVYIYLNNWTAWEIVFPASFGFATGYVWPRLVDDFRQKLSPKNLGVEAVPIIPQIIRLIPLFFSGLLIFIIYQAGLGVFGFEVSKQNPEINQQLVYLYLFGFISGVAIFTIFTNKLKSTRQ